MRMRWTLVGILVIGLFAGCRTTKKPRVPPPPPPPSALKHSARALKQPRRAPERLAPAMPHTPAAPKDVEDTDFPGQPDQPGNSVVILVKRKGPENEIAAFHKANGGKVTKFKHIKWDAVEIPKGQAAKILKKYKESTLFENIEFQRTYTVDATPNDPLFNQQWDLPRIEAQAAWDKATSNNVVVAVIDTGIDFNHPDLVQNLWTGPQGEHGYTAINGDIFNGGMDDHYHGTHVAGTIGAVGNNTIGVVGVNWHTRMAALKFIGPSGTGFTRDAILCIEKMIELKQAGHNFRVSNNSWGGSEGDSALEDAFRAAENVGIINVCAAGNSGVDIDVTPMYPAAFSLDGIVSVLASDEADNKASFSNFGIVGTDIAAPGVNILSTLTNHNYGPLSGTSMACPHVAGAMAMMFSFNPQLTASEAKTILLDPSSYDKTAFPLSSTGGGRLNLNKLWKNPAINNPLPTNSPPVLTIVPESPLTLVPINQKVTITANGVDPDADSLLFTTSANAPEFDYRWYQWLGEKFRFQGETNAYSLVGSSWAVDQRVVAQFRATDQRGGGARMAQTLWTYRDESKVKDLTNGIRNFTAWWDVSHPTLLWYRLDVDPDLLPTNAVRYAIAIKYPSLVPLGSCCHEPNRDIQVNINLTKPWNMTARAFIMDTNGNFATGPQAVVKVNNSTSLPPHLKLSLSTTRGASPLFVTADYSASELNSATDPQYGIHLFGSTFGEGASRHPVQSFILTNTGIYEMTFFIAASSNGPWDWVTEYITVLPRLGPVLTIALLEKQLRISWIGGGVLQEAANVNGPWTDSSNQSNPQNRSTTGVRQFFRMRSYAGCS